MSKDEEKCRKKWSLIFEKKKEIRRREGEYIYIYIYIYIYMFRERERSSRANTHTHHIYINIYHERDRKRKSVAWRTYSSLWHNTFRKGLNSTFSIRFAGAIELTLQRGKIPKKCPDFDTKQHWMVKLQFWRLGECEVLLYCHYSAVNSAPEC